MKKSITRRLVPIMLSLLLPLTGAVGLSGTVSAAGEALEVYVSFAGPAVGIGTGSFTDPFRSFAQVLTYIKDNKNQGKDINVILREGEYLLPYSIDFTPDIWDSADNTVTFKPYNNEKVTLSGAVPLDGITWQPYAAKPGVFVADIGTGYIFDGLVANGTRQILARYPNYQFGEILKSTISVTNSQLAEKVAAWANPAGGFIRALHVSEWGGNDYIITGKNGTTLQYTWVGDNNRGNQMNATHRIFENIFEELDAPGEWFYDKSAGKLYFYPPAGMDIHTAKFQANTLEELVTFKGDKTLKAGKTAADEFAWDYHCPRNITFENITFANTHRTLFTQKFERPLRGDWGIVRSGALYLENAEDITVKNCEFKGLGGNAVMMSAYNKGHEIDFCDFTDIGASGVLIVGLEDACRNPSTWDRSNGQPGGDSSGNHKTSMGDTVKGPRSDNYARDITVSNCYMYNLGVFEKQNAGVCISIAARVRVLRNTIHYVPRAAINVSDGTFGGHEIAYNDLFDTVRETGDHGPFNAWGRDRFWSLGGFDTNGQRGDIKEPYSLYDAIETTLVHNNRIHEIRGSFGIDLDDGASNYRVYNNLLLGASIKLREGFHRDVYNNIIVNNCFEQHCTFAQNGDIYRDNIILGGRGVNIAGGESAQQTTQYLRQFYYNGQNDVNNARGNINTGKANPQFINPNVNNYAVLSGSPVLTLTQFQNFPMTNSDFGRADKPNAPVLVYNPSISTPENAKKFIDYGYNFNTSTCIDEIDESLRSAAGLPDRDGVYLTNIGPNGYFSNQGFQQGDVIRELNGKQIKNIPDLYKAFTENDPYQNFTGVIYRNQQPQNVLFRAPDGWTIYPWMAGGTKYGSGWQVPGGRHNDEVYCGVTNVSATNNINAYYEFTFYGTGVGIQSERYNDEGRYGVYIDGEFISEITGYTAGERVRPDEIYRLDGLAPGRHLLKVVNLESKWLILDAFSVYNEAPELPDPPEPPDKTALKDLIDEAEAMDLSKYPPDAAAQVNELLDIAKSVYDDPDATDEQIETAYLNLRATIDSLTVPEPILYGDVNGDEKVDITDARLILQHLVGKHTIPEERMVHACVNGGDTVTINDARLL
ncbi:MAG: dockerin type I domain-containing protein, partial [Oscillospiraceae bacterium]|nr:dockerin type I domain-containing protein [Oscillospiraceae bacterium]